MLRPNRKTNPKVIEGRVQKKNWDGATHNYYDHPEPELVIDRRRPGPGARHLLRNEDIRKFIGLIPDWPRLSKGLNAVKLVPFNEDYFGVYNTAGVIKLSAWPRDMWLELHQEVFDRERPLLEQIGAESEPLPWGVLVKFTEPQAVAAQLLGTFLHELGHHVDRISSRRPVDCHNGEPFAEEFERTMAIEMWPVYTRAFGLP